MELLCVAPLAQLAPTTAKGFSGEAVYTAVCTPIDGKDEQ